MTVHYGIRFTYHNPETTGDVCAMIDLNEAMETIDDVKSGWCSPNIASATLCEWEDDHWVDVVMSDEMPPGSHDRGTDSAGREWLRDKDDIWWIKPTADSPWYRQKVKEPTNL